MKKTNTPTQEMMYWILSNFNKELLDNHKTNERLDDKFDKTLVYEKDLMKMFFLSGVNLISKNKDFSIDEKFNKLYYEIFPEE